MQKKRDAPIREFYKVSEVARIFGVSPQAVYKWISEEKVKAVHLGNTYRIAETEVQRLRAFGLESKNEPLSEAAA